MEQLRENVLSLTAQCAHLDEANRAWQSFQQTQADNFRSKLQEYLPIDEDTSFDQIPELIIEQLQKQSAPTDETLEDIRQSYTNTVNELNQELSALKEAYDQLDNEKQALTEELEQRSNQPVQQPSGNGWDDDWNQGLKQNVEEIEQLREDVARLTSQCAQLDEANRAWQSFQQTQADNFRSKLQEYAPINEDASFDQIPELIIEQLQSCTNTVNESNRALSALKEAYDQLEQRSNQPVQQPLGSGWDDGWSQGLKQNVEEIEQLRENVASLTAQCAQLDEANRAWQSFQQTQADNFRSKLQEYLPIDEDTSFDQIPELIIEQLQTQPAPTDETLQDIRQSYTNTVNELNQELSALKEAYDQLDNEKQVLTEELEQRSNQPVQQSSENGWDDDWNQGLKEVPLQASSSAGNEKNVEEIEQLRENVASLTAQCAQLDEANRAWQSYQQTQADNFRFKLQEYVSIDEETPFDQIPELIIEELAKVRLSSEDSATVSGK